MNSAGITRNEVTVSLLSGEVLRGSVDSFNTQRPTFYLQENQPDAEPKTRTILFEKTKMVTFLRKPGNSANKIQFPPSARLVTIRFLDHKVVHGVTQSYGGTRLGIYLVPIGEEQIDRIYVPVSAIQDVLSVSPLSEMMTEQDAVKPETRETAVEGLTDSLAKPMGRTMIKRQLVGCEQHEERSTIMNQTKKSKIGRILIAQGFIDEVQLGEALEVQKRLPGKRLGEVMVEMGFATHKMIGIALAIQCNVPFINLSSQWIDPNLQALVPKSVARQWQIVPVSFRNGTLTIAVSDPTNPMVQDDVRGQTSLVVNLVVSTPQDISRMICRYYEQQVYSMEGVEAE